MYILVLPLSQNIRDCLVSEPLKLRRESGIVFWRQDLRGYGNGADCWLGEQGGVGCGYGVDEAFGWFNGLALSDHWVWATWWKEMTESEAG